MIPRTFEQIEYSDIEALINNRVSEGKTLEYKREIPTSGDKGRGQFVTGISAMANTIGGDFIIGIRASKGEATSADGVETEDLDKEISRLEGMLRNNLEPRLSRYRIKPLSTGTDKYVFVIRVDPSLNGPHRFKENGHFYARNNNGKYQMDVLEIRNAFVGAASARERATEFCETRLTKIGKTGSFAGMTFWRGAKFVTHVVPLVSFSDEQRIRAAEHVDAARQVYPRPGAFSYLINADGIITYSERAEGWVSDGTIAFYSGQFESVTVFGAYLNSDKEIIELPATLCEGLVLTFVEKALQFYSRIDIPPPFFISASIKDGRRAVLRISQNWFAEGRPLDRDIVRLASVMAEDANPDLDRVLRPLFDSLWNAFGIAQSLNYDKDGRRDTS